MKYLRTLSITAALLALTNAPVAWSQQSWPARPVKVLVGFAPGGGGDILTRAFSAELEKSLGQPFIVENRPGANGTIAIDATAKSAPDGYTMCLVISANIIDVLVRKDMPFDLMRDIAPVSLIVTNPLVLAVNPSLPAKSFKEFLELAKSKPGVLNIGTPGIGSTNELLQELINYRAGVKTNQVAYKGGAPSQTAVLTNEVDGAWVSPTQSMPLLNAGKMRPLAISTTQRLPLLPNLPSVSETLPGVAADVWFGYGVRAGTSPAIVNQLNAELTRINKTPEMTERISKLGAIQLFSTPSEFGAFMKAEIDKWGELLKKVPIKFQ
jgi:tripartite-type tricarboxylate transporter receptor subunit TctC